jgi:hypothetical protein
MKTYILQIVNGTNNTYVRINDLSILEGRNYVHIGEIDGIEAYKVTL